MTKPTIERTTKQVIENKLLAALDDEAKVACMFSCEDLDLLIEALRFTHPLRKVPEANERMAHDLETLRKSAFGK